MVHLDASLAEQGEGTDKGLKGGALGFVSSVVVGVASTAPAYSLAATLGFVVIAINGLQAPIITIIAFIPMLCVSYGYKALNSADPDCGTTFTWGTRAFGPKTGLVGRLGHRRRRHPGDGQPGPGRRRLPLPALRRLRHRRQPNSGWVLLVGVGWIVAMTAICYVGIEISANFQKVLLGIEITMLLVLSIVALVKVGQRDGSPGAPHAVVDVVQPVRRAQSARASWSASPSCCSSTGGGTPRSRSTRRPRSATRSRAGPPSRPPSSSWPPTPSSSCRRSPTPASGPRGSACRTPTTTATC